MSAKTYNKLPDTLPYICASLPAWREQAREAIKQGQSLNEFICHVHPDNRSNALTAYRMELAKKATA